MRATTRRNLAIVAVIVVGLLIVGRVALPSIVLHEVNRRLADMDGYTGHVEDIDIALLRGAYVIHGLVIEKTDGNPELPFVTVESIDLSVEWRALLHGNIVAEVEMFRPVINFANGDSDAEKQAGSGVNWADELKDLVPLRIDRLAAHEGTLRFADFSTRPHIDLTAEHMELEAVNLTNSENLSGSLVATVDATGITQGSGRFTLHAVGDPYEQRPTFDMDAQIEGLQITALNELLEGYGKFDAESGQLDVYTEIATDEGALRGYVKPVFTDLEVLDIEAERERDHEGPLRIAWEGVVGFVGEIFTNRREDDVAAKVKLGGTIDEPQPDTWGAVWSVTKNAFIDSLFRGLDHEVSSGDLQQKAERGGGQR